MRADYSSSLSLLSTVTSTTNPHEQKLGKWGVQEEAFIEHQLLYRHKWLKTLINISLILKVNHFHAMSRYKKYNIDQIGPVGDSQSRNRVEGVAQKIIGLL